MSIAKFASAPKAGTRFHLVPLTDLGTFIRGNGLEKKDLVEQGLACIHYGQIHTTYGVKTNKSISFVSPTRTSNLRSAENGDLIIATTSEDAAGVAKAVAWLGESPVYVSGEIHIFKHSLEPRYASYLFASSGFKKLMAPYITGTKVKRISSQNLGKLCVPVPSHELQIEIANFLDNFTALEAELGAEFGARKSQYEHYLHAHIRECNISGSRVRLGDVCKVLNGFAFKSELFNNDQNGLPLIRIRDVNSGISGTYYSGDFDPNFLVDNGDLLIGMDGEFNAIRWRGGQALLNQRVCRLQEFSESVSIDYISHIVKAALKTIERNTAASTVKHLSSKQIANIELRLPTLDKQREVAQFLSRLDELISDREFGIPAEIETRKKQYEHYRDQLLAFEEA